jgi:glucose-6-phosphate 1-epimerase
MLSLLHSPLSLTVGGGLPTRSASRSTLRMAIDSSSEQGLAYTTLTNAAGDTAKIATFGACVTSYVKDGKDALAVRPDAKLDGSKPISGGIPFCFPQFGPGEIQQHGFARNVDWAIASKADGAEPSIVYELTPSDYSKGMWDQSFVATYTVTLKGDRLATNFAVKNTGGAPFSFTGALHSYWSVSSIDGIEIQGAFEGAKYLDKVAGEEKTCATKALKIGAETDAVYKGVSGDVTIVDAGAGRKLTISSTAGWSDTVVWSPYGDEGMGYNGFVCVENAQALEPVEVAAGATWTGEMSVAPSPL